MLGPSADDRAVRCPVGTGCSHRHAAPVTTPVRTCAPHIGSWRGGRRRLPDPLGGEPERPVRIRVQALREERRAGRWLDEAMTQSTPEGGTEEQRIVVVGPDGQPIGVLPADGGADVGATESSVADLVEQPAKVMRIGTMIKQLLEEVRTAPLDEASRARLRDIHRRSITELESGPRTRAGRGARAALAPVHRRPRSRASPSCASRRPSSSGGSRVSSTGSRPRCSPSRWRRRRSSSRCDAARSGRARSPAAPASPASRGCRRPATSAAAASTSEHPVSSAAR